MNLEKISERAKKLVDQTEVFGKKGSTDLILFEANRLKSSSTSYSQELALRVIKGGRVGIAYLEGEIFPEEELIGKAIEAASLGPPARFSFPPKYPPAHAVVWDKDIEKTSAERMVELGEELISQIRNHCKELVCSINMSKRVEEVSLINSSEARLNYQRSYFLLEFEGVLVQDTDMLFVKDLYISCSPKVDIAKMVGEVVWQLELSKRKAKVGGKKLPVIFTPRGVMDALFAPLSLAFNGRMVARKASPLTNRLGERVFSPKLNMRDDATLAYAFPSLPWDDEGIPGENTILVLEGVVSGFLYDLQTAGILGTSSNGKARRHTGIPSPRISTLVIEPGEDKLDDMIKDIREGLLVDQVIGAQMGNVLGGEFSGNVLLGFKIENGEIVGRVKDTMVSGNIYEAFREIISLGDRGRFVGNLFSPHICLHLSVSSK